MAKGNLLLIDDEPLILKNLQFTLEEYADKIFTANNGLEGLEVLKRETIDCIVCDINMPKMNGVEFIKKIRGEGNNVLFIFYTGHGNRDLMMEAIKYGTYDFLDKPNLVGLEEVVTRALKASLTNNKSPTKPSPEEFVSEFRTLLEKLKEDEGI